MAFFFEVLIGGLLAGVMYSLVALGFVLIYKASGVFNFAQGAMVFFAALTFVGLREQYLLAFWPAFAITLAVMIVLGVATALAAEAAALRISQAEPGSKFAVGELENAAPVAAAPASRVAGGFAVQVGALKDEAEANALRERIRGAGFAAYVERAQTDAGVLWRVRAGPELQRARADTLRDQLKQRLQLDGLVVPHP